MALYQNPVQVWFQTVKGTFLLKYGVEKLWDYKDMSCLEYWINGLDNKEWKLILSGLITNEYNDMLLIRYTRFDELAREFGTVDVWDMFDGIFMECRSIVLNIHNGEVILMPFRKFRNLNECEANSLENVQHRIANASQVEITDKLDGSMVSARWYNDSLVISGSQAIDPANSWRLQNYYKWFSEHQNYVDMVKTGQNYTYIFEAIFPEDSHVVRYDDSMTGLHLIGIRSVRYGYEFPYARVNEIAEEYSVPHAEVFDITLDKVLASLGDKSSDEAEGFVIWIDGYRVKVKYDDYVSMHKILSKLSSPNMVMDAIREDRWDDFFAKVPSAYKSDVKEIADAVFDYINGVDAIVYDYYDTLRSSRIDLTDRKAVMIWIEKNVSWAERGWVRMLYLNRPIKAADYLKGRKYSDILEFLQ